MRERVCQRCAFWEPRLSRLLGENADAVAPGIGECRRNAPRGPVALGWAGEGHPLHSAVMSPFPLTHCEDWCGQWQSNEPI